MSDLVGHNSTQGVRKVDIPGRLQFFCTLIEHVGVTTCSLGGQEGHAEDLLRRTWRSWDNAHRQGSGPLEAIAIRAVCPCDPHSGASEDACSLFLGLGQRVRRYP